MITKSRITLVVAILWAIIEYFTQIWPLAHISFWWWLFFGITLWSGLFWFADTMENRLKPTNRPRIECLTVLLSWVLIPCPFHAAHGICCKLGGICMVETRG